MKPDEEISDLPPQTGASQTEESGEGWIVALGVVLHLASHLASRVPPNADTSKRVPASLDRRLDATDEVFARVAKVADASLRFERFDGAISSHLEMPVRIRSTSIIRRLRLAGHVIREFKGEFGPAPIEMTEADFARLIKLCRRILANLGVDASRKRGAAKRFESVHQAGASPPNPADVAIQRETSARLRRILAELPARDRKLLTEYLIDGVKLPAMAERRHVSVSTLSRRIQGILRRLREAVGE